MKIFRILIPFLACSFAFANSSISSHVCSLQAGSWAGQYQVLLTHSQGSITARINIDNKGHITGKYATNTAPAKSLTGHCKGNTVALNGGLAGIVNGASLHLQNELIDVKLFKAV